MELSIHCFLGPVTNAISRVGKDRVVTPRTMMTLILTFGQALSHPAVESLFISVTIQILASSLPTKAVIVEASA